MKNVRIYLVLSLTIVLLVGCLPVQEYALSPDNVTALRALEKRVSVGPFTPEVKHLNCRGTGTISAPGDNTFSEFVRQAFIAELKTAERYAADAPVELTGRLDRLNVSSISGDWNIVLTVNSSNGRSITIPGVYNFGFSFVGDEACAVAARAFMPAVQGLIGKVATHPEFPNLVR